MLTYKRRFFYTVISRIGIFITIGILVFTPRTFLTWAHIWAIGWKKLMQCGEDSLRDPVLASQ
jgi:hypothetical protein